MYNQSVLPDELKTFDYYFNKLPLYLKNSEGFVEHFRLWFDLLDGKDHDVQLDSGYGVLLTEDTILYLLNIFDGDFSSIYLNTIRNLSGSEAAIDDLDPDYYGTVSDILDKLAALYGVRRVFSVTFNRYNSSTEMYETVTEDVNLNNEDLLTLIKAQIIKNYCDGTYKQIVEYYKDVGLEILPITSDIPATCILYLQKIPTSLNYNYSDNIERMFLAGLLNIVNMGIDYRHVILDLDNVLVWYTDETIFNQQLNPDNPVWDSDATLWDIGEWMA